MARPEPKAKGERSTAGATHALRVRSAPATLTVRGLKPAAAARALAVALGLALLPGCVLLPQGQLPPGMIRTVATATGAASAAKEVKVGGRGLNLGETQQAAVTRQQFVQKTAELLAANRRASARRYIERYPDVALEALRDSTGPEAATPALQWIAEVHDDQCGSTWLALLRDRAANPTRTAAYEQARARFAEQLQAGHTAEALAFNLPGHVGHKGDAPVLVLDAEHLQGSALLLAGKPAEAEAAFGRALQAVATGDLAAQVQLIRSEALRRCGKIDEANACWREAVAQAARLLAQAHPVADPIFWERASYLRPVESDWPAVAVQAMAQLGSQGKSEPSVDAGPDIHGDGRIWYGIGRMRLQRGEGQAALVAFKRAETLATAVPFQARLQLAQARALLQMNLDAAATPILVRLADQADGLVAGEALALLGAVRLQDNMVAQSQTLLRRAIEKGPADGPKRGATEADLGLACLTLGNEADGLNWLHTAQSRFLAAGDQAQLSQCLANEMNYYVSKKRTEQAEAIRQRLELLEKS